MAAPLFIAGVVAWTFAPATGFPFLNWDDEAVVVRNAALDRPDVVRWSLTTTYMQHYQPASWMVWAAVKRAAGLEPSAFHAVNLAAHGLCALLVFAVALAVFRRAQSTMPERVQEAAAVMAALVYAVHPLRVEVVAWISALPYSLALALCLLSVLAWLRSTDDAAAAWWTAAFALFVLSLAARPIALGLPVVLWLIDYFLLGRSVRQSLRRVLPFALVAALAAIVEGIARAPGVNETPWLFRVQSAVTAPFVYAWHTFAPLRLTPLDLLPTAAASNPLLLATAILALVGGGAAAWRSRHRWPWLWLVLVAYLALLAPAAGLIPSGLQATADRYTYLPGVVLAIAIAAALATWACAGVARGWIAVAGATVIIAASSVATRQMLRPWSSSIALWSRVVELEPTHDVGLYNLGAALEAAGRGEDAAVRYREVLAVEPQHAAARANLDRLDATRLEREGNDAAARGDLAGAVERYRRAVGLDSRRTHAQAGLGMALASLGRTTDAIPPLREAIAQGSDDPEVANALAGLLAEAGQPREARAVLEAALGRHPADINLGHNLARLLVTDAQFAAADSALALRLATAIANATGGRDPRALDTLAAALALNGRTREAAETSDRAARLAAAQGDRELAVQITARGRAYRNPGR